MKINNLAHLKRALHEDAEFRIIRNRKHPETIRLVRRVNKTQTNAVYTVIKDDPENFNSRCNGGSGLRMDFEKSSHYHFGDTVSVFSVPGDKTSLMYEFEVLTPEGGKA